MSAVESFKVPSSALMTLTENSIFNPKAVNISLPNITEYLPFADSSTCHFQVTIFVALISGKVKYILIFRLVVTLPNYV